MFIPLLNEISLLSLRFAEIEIKSVKFENSLFENCYFEDVKSTNTFFENCTIKNTVFYNTGIMHIYTLQYVYSPAPRRENCLQPTVKYKANTVSTISFSHTSVLCRPLGGKVQKLSNGEYHLPPSKERLPSQLSGGERHCHLHGQLPGQFGCVAWQHHLSVVHGQDRKNQNNR